MSSWHWAKMEIPCENLLRLFEVKLLEMTGHGLMLDREADHETEIQPHAVYSL